MKKKMTTAEKNKEIARIRKKKSCDLDEAMLAGTGMDRSERETFRETNNKLFAERKAAKEGSKAWKKASNEIARLNGFPATY